MSFKSRLTDRAAILQPARTEVDAWNNPTTTYVAPSTPVDLRSVPCFHYVKSGSKDFDTERTASIHRDYFDFMPSVPITPEDRLQFDGGIYRIIRADLVGARHHIMVEAERIQVSS